MTWTVIEGIYRDGQIHLKEEIGYREPLDILVLIPDQVKPSNPSRSWEKLRQKIAAEMPELLAMPEQEKRVEFDRLSVRIANNMPYRSVEEFEQAMRGDQYGLARH